jgi:hypothetical protein
MHHASARTRHAQHRLERIGNEMGNLAGEANWSGTNGEFALLTTLIYTWNPAAYDPATAAATAERILAA